MVDCSKANGGCNGGDPQYVYTDIMSKFPSRGIYTNAVYPVRLKSVFFFLKLNLRSSIIIVLIKVYWNGRHLSKQGHNLWRCND